MLLMNIFLAKDMPNTLAIILTIVAILVMIGLSVLFLFLIKRNIRITKEENDIIVESAITKRAMEDSIRSYIKKVDRFGALTLLYIDVDGFSDLNEVFGHEACDQILKEMAARILRALPYQATLCRYTADEFLVFIKDEDNKARVEKLANQINDVITSPYQVMVGETIRITASIGFVTYPVAGETFEDLYANLQLTTYVSKRDGGNKATSFYATIKEEETGNMLYYQEIKRAIANKEFVLYYQPIVNLDKSALEGAEALMRWNHPTKGVQAPATFLKVLEQSGDIRWVGEWGLETMVRLQQQFKVQFPLVPMRFSLNLSTKQLLDSTLSNRLIDIMSRNNAKPESYMLEISDFMMMERIAMIKTNIFKLRDYGFKIAVDGFELDGQSVQSIQRSPIDVIKLGRGFLKDIENNFMKERLLQILLKFCNDNGKQLISEGVETAEVAKYVKEQGVGIAQGYLFAKPMSQEAFTEYLESGQCQHICDEVKALIDSESLLNDDENDVEIIEDDSDKESADELLRKTIMENKVDPLEQEEVTVEEEVKPENTDTVEESDL